MITKIHSSWKTILKDELKKPYYLDLLEFIKTDYSLGTCYPPKNEIFAAFDACPFQELKVVIIGQDPYHGKNQAHGLCFSVNDGISHPPSLKNIYKELTNDVDMPYPNSGNLMHWAKQGVLLLNATLTVREGEAGSHQKKGWEVFTDAVIQQVSEQRENVVFLLWGGYAKKKGKKINRTKHLVLETGHPSPLSANRGFWFGNKHFSKANTFLKLKGNKPINW